jgi:hypothetical protein
MVKSGLSGQYGAIPHSVIRKKYEVTKGYENPYHTDDYQRSILKDTRPDAPFMESDQIRYDNHSAERLSLRHEGHRTGEAPDHSEMFLELTERDPRGTAVDPDFGKYREQAYSRKDYYRFYSDADHSVTDWQSTPITAMRNRMATFEDVKRRLKIFSTGKGSMMAARNFKHTADSNIDLTAGQLPLISIPEAVFEDIEDRTAIRSNGTNIGWHRTTDHEFDVAQYGQAPVALKPSNAEVNRQLQEPDSFMEEQFKDTRVNAGLAVLMQDIMKEREVQRSALPSQKIHIAKQMDVYKKMYQKPETTDISRTEIKQEMSRLQGLMNQLADMGTENMKQNSLHGLVAASQNSRNKTQYDKEQMANSMSGAMVNPGNRQQQKRKIMEIASAKTNRAHADGMERFHEHAVRNNGTRKPSQTAAITDGLQTVKLSGLAPMSSLASNQRKGDMHKYVMGSGEEYAHEAYDAQHREGNANTRAGRTDNDATEDTAGWTEMEGQTKDRHTRAPGSKYVQDILDSDHSELNVMGDQ